MTTKKTGARSFFQAVADAEKQFGEHSPEAVRKLFDLLDYYESIGDRDGTMHCMNWIQQIIQHRPQDAKKVGTLVLAASRKISQAKRRRLQKGIEF